MQREQEEKLGEVVRILNVVLFLLRGQRNIEKELLKKPSRTELERKAKQMVAIGDLLQRARSILERKVEELPSGTYIERAIYTLLQKSLPNRFIEDELSKNHPLVLSCLIVAHPEAIKKEQRELLLNNKDEGVREAATRIWARELDREQIQAALKDQSESVKLIVIAEVPEKIEESELVPLLQHPSARVRRAAEKAIVEKHEQLLVFQDGYTDFL